MCMCNHRNGKPNINGEPGYCWNRMDEPATQVRPIDPPALLEGDTLLYDEPGRCNADTDSHCHHFRLVRNSYGDVVLIVRHGAGDERINIGRTNRAVVSHLVATMDAADTHSRYWLMQALYHSHSDAAKIAMQKERARWALAAANKRIKVRRHRTWTNARVEIVPAEKDLVGFSL
jgi:hypothetical protein